MSKERALLEAIMEVAPKDMATLGLTPSTLRSVRVLGGGANGVAYLLPTDIVLKWTRDYDEAAIGKRLLPKAQPGLPRVIYSAKLPKKVGHHARQTRGRGGDEYLLALEYAVPSTALPAPVRREFKPVSKVIDGKADASTLNKQQRQWLGDLIKAVRFIEQQDMFDEEAIFYLGEECDCHEGNLGLVERNGRLMAVIIDLGQGATAKPPKVRIARNRP